MENRIYHIVHANIATMRAPFDDPRMIDFVAMVDQIDALAHASPGFVAQPTPPDEGTIYRDPVLLNLSIWESVESLRQFTYAGQHQLALSRRIEWFTQQPQPNYVLFWMPAGEIPTETEIARRVGHLREYGPTPYAFNFEYGFQVGEMLRFQPRNFDV